MDLPEDRLSRGSGRLTVIIRAVACFFSAEPPSVTDMVRTVMLMTDLLKQSFDLIFRAHRENKSKEPAPAIAKDTFTGMKN